MNSSINLTRKPLTLAESYSPEFIMFQRHINLIRQNVVTITVKTRPGTAVLKCYQNCELCKDDDWRPLTGWLLYKSTSDGSIFAEHHSVLHNGSDFLEVSPHKWGSITFLPDPSFSFAAIRKLANVSHVKKRSVVVAGYTIKVINAGKDVKITHQHSGDKRAWLMRDDLIATQNKMNASRKKKNRKKKNNRKKNITKTTGILTG